MNPASAPTPPDEIDRTAALETARRIGPPGEAPPSPACRRARRRLLVPALTVALSLTAGAAGGALVARDDDATTPAGVVATPARASTTFERETLDVAAVLARVQDSVVSIETTVRTRRGPFVGQSEGAGTGVVIDADGDIVTNAHVVDGATSIRVTLPGARQARTATLVAEDEAADIAVLHVDDTEGLVAADVAAGGRPQVGDQVVAIGNALALEGGLTVTQGIVSAVDRTIETGSGTLSGLIQTDAAISSGNSGGPLVNAAGQVVGINTAVAASYGGVQASNIGFAISIDRALAVAASLLGDTA